MQRVGSYVLLAVVLIVTPAISPGCSNTKPRMGDDPGASEKTDKVAGTPLFRERMFLFKTHTLPAGDIIKRWHWDKPWEIRNNDGAVVRRMYSPEWSPDGPITEGPHITIIQDPQRGTIYEAFFVQRTEAIFDLPMTLFFFATRESQSPLFSLSFTDSTAAQCQPGRVSRGNIKLPQVPQTTFDTAQWIGIGWQSTTYQDC
jgi:hypothetical protein